MDDAESAHAIVLHIPTLKALITGDLVYNKVNLWLAEGRMAGWKSSLDILAKKYPKVEMLYTGHGANGGKELLALNKSYIDDFEAILKTAKTKAEAMEVMKAKHPDMALPIISDIAFATKLK